MLFGTPAKLFDGGKTEDEFWSFISTGYGRRCFFGYMRNNHKDLTLTAEEIYDLLTDKSSNQFLADLSIQFGQLADRLNFEKKLPVAKTESLILIEYRMHCEQLAEELGDHAA